MMNRKIIKWLVIVLAAFALIGCKQKPKIMKKETIVTAKVTTPVTPLFFEGTVTPIINIPVLSPVDGRVSKMNFKYGQKIIQGQSLVIINSPQLAKDYRAAISNFLKMKDAYFNQVQSFQGSEGLYQAGIISRQQYLNNKSQYESSILAYYQARFTLEKILHIAGMNPKAIEKLRLQDTKQIDKLLQRRFTHLVVKAPGAGVALFPIPGQGGDGDNSKGTGNIREGSQVKTGQLILSIGDLKGFKVAIQVSEININRISAGMNVAITGEAFPGITLKGGVSQVSSQAEPQQGGSGLSMFNVQITVPKVSALQRKVIHVGMSAKVQIDIKETPRIMLPIKAVCAKDGNRYVTLIDKQGKRKRITVVTGITTPLEVSITSGIKAGDKVVVNDQVSGCN